MSVAEFLFELPSTDAWETRLQVTYLSPVEPSDPNLPVEVDSKPPPRANIVVSRLLATETDPGMECRKFLSQTIKSVPNVEIVSDITPLNFNDGVLGAVTEISFPATPEVRLTQFHAFRIDDGLLTQLVATLAEVEAPQNGDELRRRLLSFAPRLAPTKLPG